MSDDNPYGFGGRRLLRQPSAGGAGGAPHGAGAATAGDSSRTRRPPASPATSSRNRASSRCWSISGRRGAGRASSSRRCSKRRCAQAGGKVKLVKMNIDDHPSIAGQLGIQSIPAVIAFKNGQPVDGFMGAVPESQIREFIEKVVGKDAGGRASPKRWRPRPRRARPAMRRPPPTSIGACCEQTPDNVEAIGRPGRSAVRSRRRREARGGARPVPADKQDDACRCCRARQDRACRAGSGARQSGRIRGRLAEDPDDHQARFDLAVVQNARGQARRGGRQSAGDRQGRPHLERRRRAGAACCSSSKPGA